MCCVPPSVLHLSRGLHIWKERDQRFLVQVTDHNIHFMTVMWLNKVTDCMTISSVSINQLIRNFSKKIITSEILENSHHLLMMCISIIAVHQHIPVRVWHADIRMRQWVNGTLASWCCTCIACWHTHMRVCMHASKQTCMCKKAIEKAQITSHRTLFTWFHVLFCLISHLEKQWNLIQSRFGSCVAFCLSHNSSWNLFWCVFWYVCVCVTAIPTAAIAVICYTCIVCMYCMHCCMHRDWTGLRNLQCCMSILYSMLCSGWPVSPHPSPSHLPPFPLQREAVRNASIWRSSWSSSGGLFM